jgi:hypothetical protein
MKSAAHPAGIALLSPHLLHVTGQSGIGPSNGTISVSGIFTNRQHFSQRRMYAGPSSP